MSTLAQMIKQVNEMPLRPQVVYIGSTSKCKKQFQRVQLYDTIRPDPRIFYTIGCSHMSDADLVQAGVHIDKDALDLLHFQKIQAMAYACQMLNVSCEVCVLDLNDNGAIRIGESTAREESYTHYLIELGYPITVRYWSEEQDAVRTILKNLVIG